MDGARDDDHGPARLDQLADRRLALIRKQSWVGQPALNLLELVEPFQIFRRRYRGDDKRAAQRSFTEGLEFDPVARLCKLAEIGDELIPSRQFTVFADLEAEFGLRRGDVVGLGLGAGPHRLRRDDGERSDQKNSGQPEAGYVHLHHIIGDLTPSHSWFRGVTGSEFLVLDFTA